MAGMGIPFTPSPDGQREACYPLRFLKTDPIAHTQLLLVLRGNAGRKRSLPNCITRRESPNDYKKH